jgi:hypothetical protein
MSTYEVNFYSGSLGLGLSEHNEVVELDEQGQASQTNCIRIGDLLLSVNNTHVHTLEESAEQFSTQPRPMVLKFQRRDALYVGEGSFGVGSDVLSQLRNYFQSIDFLQTVEEFCLDHCDPFDGESEMLLVYTEIFDKFKQLFEDRIEDFVTDRGVSLEDFYSLCKEANTDNDDVSAFLEMIHASFQFDSFVKLMRGQKIKKEMWGDPRYTDQVPPPPPPPPVNHDDDDSDGYTEYDEHQGGKFEGKSNGGGDGNTVVDGSRSRK